MPLVLDDVIRVSLINFTQNQLGVNVLHYRVSDVRGTQPAIAGIADFFDDLFGPLYRAVMSASASHRGLTLSKVYPGFASVQTVSVSSAGAGTVAGDMMSLQTSGIITWQTDLAGRAFRGRSYIPFPAEADNDSGGHPTAGYVTGITNIGAQYAGVADVGDPADGITFVPIIFRRGAPGLSQQVTGFRANTKWATQRRRGDYGRTNALPF